MGLIKTQSEIEKIRESSQIVADVLRLLEKYVHEGVSTKDLDIIAEDFIRSCGARPAFKGIRIGHNVFPATLCVSIDEEVVHGIPSDRKLSEGEIVSIDVGTWKNGFYGDGAKTFSVGTISDEKKKLVEVTEKSLYLGIEKATEGNKLHDISSAIQKCVEENGYSVVRDLCGHGLGSELWEFPQIPNFVPERSKKGENINLLEGMVLAIEPMVNYGRYEVKVKKDKWTVYAEDMFPSAHFEHTILVKNGEPEILTI